MLANLLICADDVELIYLCFDYANVNVFFLYLGLQLYASKCHHIVVSHPLLFQLQLGLHDASLGAIEWGVP